MAILSPPPKLQLFDANGNPLVGGKLYSYAAGTTTPLATYTDSTETSANTNPVILDSRGEAGVWLGSSLYKLALYSATDVLIWSVDNVNNAAGLSPLSVTTAIIANNAVTPAKMANGGAEFGMRNRIINGDMRVAKRGASGALTTGYEYLSIDRFAAAQATAANGVFAQVAAGLTGFQYAAKLGRTAASTGTGVIQVRTALETINSVPLQGQQVTLSFYAKAGTNFSSAGSVLSVQLSTGTGTDETVVNMNIWTGLATPIGAAQTITTSWVRYSFTATLSATATQVGITLFYTPSGTAGADDNVYFTGVQLEVGSVATPFEQRPYGTELALCQRYFYKSSSSDITGAWGAYYTSTAGRVWKSFPVSMRATPSITYSSLVFDKIGAGVVTATSISGTVADNETVSFDGFGLTASTIGSPLAYRGVISASAEL